MLYSVISIANIDSNIATVANKYDSIANRSNLEEVG